MHLTLRQLEIFSAVARSGSTTAAALGVSLSQSATSAALNELERALGAALFDRVGKRLQLNDSGRALLPTALAVLDGARHIETSFASPEQPLSDLRLFASTTIGNYMLPALLARFRRLVPSLRLDLRIGNTSDVITAVRDFHTDLGLIEGPSHDPDIAVLPWMEDELVIAAAPHHPLTEASAQAPLTTQQLAAAECKRPGITPSLSAGGELRMRLFLREKVYTWILRPIRWSRRAGDAADSTARCSRPMRWGPASKPASRWRRLP